MKQKIISTSKAEILVVDLPEDAQKVVIDDGEIFYLLQEDSDDLLPHHFPIPEGDWQSLTFDEETAKSIVDYNELNDEFLGPTLFYRKYPDELHENFVNTALESLQSLIDTNVLMKNPFGDKEPEFEDTGDIEGDYNDWANKATEWQQAEESVFKNPHFWYKLK